MPKITYFIISPLIGAAIGWFTNWLAIRMLFRPYRPVRILGLTFQGVIPRRHAQLAERIAETVEDRLLTQEDLEKAMSGVGWHDEVHGLIRTVLHDSGPGGIIDKIPGLSQVWKKAVLPSLQEVLGKEVVRFLDRYRSSFLTRLRGSVNIREIVQNKVQQFEVEALESLVVDVAKKEFSHIQWVGAVTGALIGVAQGIIFLLTF